MYKYYTENLNNNIDVNSILSITINQLKDAIELFDNEFCDLIILKPKIADLPMHFIEIYNSTLKHRIKTKDVTQNIIAMKTYECFR